MCRGNNRSAWHAEGSSEPIAEKAFSQLQVDRFPARVRHRAAGGFEPFRLFRANKMVVLGLIGSAEPALESSIASLTPDRRNLPLRPPPKTWP